VLIAQVAFVLECWQTDRVTDAADHHTHTSATTDVGNNGLVCLDTVCSGNEAAESTTDETVEGRVGAV